jgi:DNA mismatch repair protein MutL
MPVDERKAHRMPIAQLPPHEVERIAAGEVVERPVNVVKELIENALDAGATAISVELEDGGKQLISVEDDGWGIPAAELHLALLPHHTSKIASLDDIYRLESLGFRGEALSSIGAVSKMTVKSRHQGEDIGARIEAAGGEILPAQPFNMSGGTVVCARELFYNTPVRQKFLRSRQSETGMVAKLLASYALAFPDVRWLLTSSGRTVLEATGDGDLRSVLTDLAGKDLAGALVRVDYEFPPLGISGLISAPHVHRHNRSRQWYFVNRRPVTNRVLFRAVDDAVREFVSPGKFPACALFLELPPEEIDVNIHPMKTEVNFSQPQAVYSLITTGVRRALGSAASSKQQRLRGGLAAVIKPVKDRPPGEQPVDPPPPGTMSRPPGLELTEPPAEQKTPPARRGVPLYEEGESIAPQHDALPASQPRAIEFPGAQAAESDGEGAADLPVDAGEPVYRRAGLSVYQVAGSYLVVCTPDSLYLVDQHAAHERILFESIYEDFTAEGIGKSHRQKLLFALAIDLSPDEAEQAGDYLSALEQLGFACSVADRTLTVSEVPAPLARHVTAELIHGVLADLARRELPAALSDRAKEAAASLACRAAIKANHRLSPAERGELISQLLSRWSSLSCPHGRPTIIELGRAELEQLFLR